MTIDDGSRRLGKALATWFAVTSFPIIWLVSQLAGCGLSTSLVRATVGSLVLLFLGGLLAAPLAATVVDLLARGTPPPPDPVARRGAKEARR